MKCYVFRWNPESSPLKKEDYQNFYNNYEQNKDDNDISFTWEIAQWENAHKGDMFIFLQTHSNNDGILIIGKFASEPYYKESKRTGYKGKVIDLQILSAFDRKPDSKILVTFQLEKEFPEINWQDGVCGELIDTFVADRLSIRIMEELMARDIWNQWTFSDFFGIKQYYLDK